MLFRSKDQLKKCFCNHLTGINKEEVADIIIEQLSRTDYGLTQLTMAMLGLKRQFAFKILDEVWVNIKSLNYWSINEELMKSKGMIINGYSPCKIIEIDEYRNECYKVTHDYIRSGEDQLTTGYYFVSEESIRQKDNLIEDITSI